MTVLKEFTQGSQDRFHIRCAGEFKDFQRSAVWWAKKVSVDDEVFIASTSMLEHFKKFVKFRRAVIDGMEFEAAMQDWVGCYEDLDSSQFGQKTNAPQHGFRDIYREAMWDLKCIRELEERKGYLDEDCY